MLLNTILQTIEMHEEWKVNTIIPLYKNKRDIYTCGNHKGIKFVSHIMKLWEWIIKRRLRSFVNISTNQFGFFEEVHYEDYSLSWEINGTLWGKDERSMYGCKLMWSCLKKKGIPMEYIQVVQACMNESC